MRTSVTLLLGLVLGLCAGCSSMDQSRNRHTAYNENAVSRTFQTQVGNAVVLQHTLYPYHFVTDSTELNPLGRREMRYLAAHLREVPVPPSSKLAVQAPVEVYFDYDAALLRADARKVLDTAADTLKQHPEMKLQVTGAADARGSESYNLNLGRRRAEAVREYLRARGVDNPVELVSRGEMDARAAETDESGMQRDRNVHFTIVSETEGERSAAGRLTVVRGDAPDWLYAGRVDTVVSALRACGVSAAGVAISSQGVGGDGVASGTLLQMVAKSRE